MGDAAVAVEHRPGAAQPWSPEGTPIALRARARRVPGWGAQDGVAGPVPESPVAAAAEDETVELIPFGAARLRISQFPTVA